MTRSSLFLVTLIFGIGFVPLTTARPGFSLSSSFAEEAAAPEEPTQVNPALINEDEEEQPSSPAAAEDAEVQQDEEDEAEGE